jgi:hypothetical protein
MEEHLLRILLNKHGETSFPFLRPSDVCAERMPYLMVKHDAAGKPRREIAGETEKISVPPYISDKLVGANLAEDGLVFDLRIGS